MSKIDVIMKRPFMRSGCDGVDALILPKGSKQTLDEKLAKSLCLSGLAEPCQPFETRKTKPLEPKLERKSLIHENEEQSHDSTDD